MSGCLRLCTAASCRSRGATALLRHADLPVKEVGCLGPCSEGPLLAVDEQLLSLQHSGASDAGALACSGADQQR